MRVARRSCVVTGAAALTVVAAIAIGAGPTTRPAASLGAHAPSGGLKTASLIRPPASAARAISAHRLALPALPSTQVESLAPTRRTSLPIGQPCTATTEVQCGKVTVPLDRTGAVPGTIDLKVQVLPALGVERGVMFLIAGGPGQGSAHVFGLLDPSQVWYYEFLFPGYTLVAVDNRGTGESGLLDCPTLQVGYPIEEEPARVKVCGEKVGPSRVFYATRDHAEDLEAVRVALGVPKIALWGTSYGTKLAAAYALAHPGNVDRLLLDSVVPTDLDDPYRATSFRELPKSLREFCAGGRCKATPDFAGDVIAMANALAATPARVPVRRANGSTATVRVTGLDLLSVVVEADLNPGLAAELPAAVNAARRGNLVPLARLVDLFYAGSAGDAIDLSGGLFAATVCADGPLPWAVDAPIEGREAVYAAGVAALPAGAFGDFGDWAADFGNGHFCLGWPAPSGGAKLGAGPLPNVPMLAVTGGLDMRTPAASAFKVAAKFPQGRVIVVPAVGHSVLSADPSFCSGLATRQWMTGKTLPDSCARAKSYVAPVGPLTGFSTRGRLSPKQTLAAVRLTLDEAEAALNFATPAAPGLAGGRLEAGGVIRLVRYSIVPGVEVSGTVAVENSDFPIGLAGTVTIGGARAADGVLRVNRDKLAGALGGTVFG